MKFKKLLAGITAAALAVSAMTFSSLTASAENGSGVTTPYAQLSFHSKSYGINFDASDVAASSYSIKTLTPGENMLEFVTSTENDDTFSEGLDQNGDGDFKLNIFCAEGDVSDIEFVSIAIDGVDKITNVEAVYDAYARDRANSMSVGGYSISIPKEDLAVLGDIKANSTVKVTVRATWNNDAAEEPADEGYLKWTKNAAFSYTIESVKGFSSTSKDKDTITSNTIAIKDVLATGKEAKDVKEVKITAPMWVEGAKIIVSGEYTDKEGERTLINRQCAFSDDKITDVLGISEGQGLLGDDLTLTVEELPAGAKVTIILSFEYKEVADTDEPEAGSDEVEIALTKTSDGILTFPYSELEKYDELVVTYKPALGTACGHTGHNAGETYCTWAKIAFCGLDTAGGWQQPADNVRADAAEGKDQEVCTATVKVSKIIASFGDAEMSTICLGEWSATLVKIVGIPKSEQSGGTDTPVDDGLIDKVNAKGDIEVKESDLDDEGLVLIPYEGSNNILTATYEFAPEDTASVTITPAEGVDYSKWTILLKGFDNNWGGWKSLESEEGSLTLTGTIKDIMDANSMSSISELQGFIFQIGGTAVGDKFSYELVVRGKKVTAPSTPEENVPTVTPSTPTVPSAPSAGMPAAVIGKKPAGNSETASSTSDGEKKTVSLSGSTSVSKDTLAEIAGKDVDVEFELSNGVTWEVNGLDVEDAQRVDLGVTLKTKKATAKQLETIAKDNDTFQFSLNHSGDFGFTAVINVPVNAKYNGQFANLYWFHDGKFDFIGSSKVEKGVVDFRMTHASDYVIVFDDEAYGEDVSSAAGVYEESETASAAPIAIAVTLAALAVSAVIIKKRVF